MNRLRGRRIAMVFQDPTASLQPMLSIGSQLTDHMRHHLHLDKRAASARAVELLERVRVPDPQARAAPLPAPVLRRPAAADRDRDRDRLRADRAHRRRADHGARRHRAGRDPAAAPGADRRPRARGAARHPRPRRHVGGRGHRRRDADRRGRRARHPLPGDPASRGPSTRRSSSPPCRARRRPGAGAADPDGGEQP